MSSLKLRLESVLQMPVSVGEPVVLQGAPRFIRQRYRLLPLRIVGERWLAVELLDTETFTPVTFLKHLAPLAPYMEGFQGYCLIADDLPAYVLPRLVEKRIPFVASDRRVFWPDLGVHYRRRSPRGGLPKATREHLAPATQVLFLHGLYRAPGVLALQAAAEATGYTPMTISRASDELEARQLIRTEKRGAGRLLCFDDGPGVLWQKGQVWLRNPVRSTVRVMQRQLAGVETVSAGESALAAYSMLSPPVEPVMALGPAASRKHLSQVEPVPFADEQTCLVEIWRYDPFILGSNGQADPCSLLLSLAEHRDERLAIAIDEFKEEFEWFKV